MALNDQPWFQAIDAAFAAEFERGQFADLVLANAPFTVTLDANAGYENLRHAVIEQAYAEEWLGHLVQKALEARPDSQLMGEAAKQCWEAGIYELPQAMAIDKSVIDIEAPDMLRDFSGGLEAFPGGLEAFSVEEEETPAPAPSVIRRAISSIFGRFRSTTQTRRLDAAMPKMATVNQTTEVRAMVALDGSPGLRAFLPDFTESGDLIERDDVRGQEVTVQFERESEPITLYLKVDCSDRDFEIDQEVQSVQVFADRNSGVVTFFLTPLRKMARGRVAVSLFEDAKLQTQLGSANVSATVGAEATDPEQQTWVVASASGSLPFINATLRELVNLVAECDSMDDPNSRDDFVGDLPPEIRNHIERRTSTFDDVRNILRRCFQLDHGLDTFVTLLRDYEGESLPYKAVATFLQKMQSEESEH